MTGKLNLSKIFYKTSVPFSGADIGRPPLFSADFSRRARPYKIKVNANKYSTLIRPYSLSLGQAVTAPPEEEPTLPFTCNIKIRTVGFVTVRIFQALTVS